MKFFDTMTSDNKLWMIIGLAFIIGCTIVFSIRASMGL